MDTIRPEHPRPEHFLLHLSDTHLVGGGVPLAGTLDSEARLRRILDELEASGARPEALVFTGDLADKGEPTAYARLRAVVEPAAERLGARVIWAMGNHDDRANLRECLLDEGRDSAPLDRVYWLGGLRVITLDTTVPGAHHGALSTVQLEWLADALATPAPEGTLLALHHPPVPSVQPLAILVELRGQAALAEVLRGSDVRAILGGHLHYSTHSTFAGIPVSVASATCYTQDLAGPLDASTGIRGTRGRDAAQAYNLVHVYRDAVVHSVVPAAGGALVGQEHSPRDVARILAEHGIQYDAGAQLTS
ncbi:phosphodiesterase [Zafaria sp. Z1313]|uniref:phosphodiesterase n=1 Tax=unclassified Zafaria TaxID=2828765 RepID=UPI002E7A906E|nr:phosphodiesterase [Zafaria sp. J156]MEE1621819.1 phosphodiesterase [Zafaria sp. J156]